MVVRWRPGLLVGVIPAEKLMELGCSRDLMEDESGR